MKNKILQNRRSKSFQISEKVNVDTKLTYTALLLSYAFEYGVDFKNRVIRLTGAIEEGYYDLIDAALTEMESESKQTITIKINSPGGDTYEAMAIVARIEQSKAYIVTEGIGHIMSAAALILACGNKRRMSRLAWYMWHESSYGIEDRHSRIKATTKQLDREEKLWADTMETYSFKKSSFWLKEGTGIDAYFTASELKKLGVVDEVF